MLYVKKLAKDDSDTKVVETWLSENAEFKKLGVNSEDAMFEPGTGLALIHDEQGPLMALRFHRALRVVAQVNPEAKERVEAAQKEVAAWVYKLAVEGKTKEIVVRSGEEAASVVEELGCGDFNGKFVSVR